MCFKATYNPTGTFQSTQFTCDVVSPNIISLRDSTHQILEMSEAPSGGYAHTHPNDNKDVFAILGQLLKEKVFHHNPGRRNTNDTKPSRDLYRDGVTALCTTDILAKYVAKKTQRHGIPGDGAAADTQEEEENSGNGFYSENFWSWDLDAGDDCGEEFEIGL